jgi:hypothetical protein
MRGLLLGVSMLCCAVPLAAQHDFLTTYEADQVREAQEPNQRLKLYLTFARQRLDQVQTLLNENRPGRAGLVHDLLDQYGSIIDAIDTVSDDALGRHLDIKEGTKEVASTEKELLASLEKIRDSRPKDLARFEFVLTQAIDATSDSMDTASEDLGKRSAEVAAREKREKQEVESMMSSEEQKARKAQAAKEAQEGPKRKKPTLLKKGETVEQPR